MKAEVMVQSSLQEKMIRQGFLLLCGVLALCHGCAKNQEPDLGVISLKASGTSPVYENATGALEYTGDGVIHGWAYNPTYPSQAATVKIYFNGIFNGDTLADQRRVGLEYLNCTGNVGFNYHPKEIPAGKNLKVTAFVVNKPSEELIPLPCVGNCIWKDDAGLTGDTIGVVENISADEITGWVSDPGYPEPEIQIFVDGKLNGTTTTKVQRVGLEYINGGKCGFRYAPVNLGTDTKQKVEVYIKDQPAGALTKVKNMPSTNFWISAPSPAATGAVERADAGWVTGWAFDPAVENATVRLYVNGQLLGETQTSVPRPGLKPILGRDGTFGFELPMVGTGGVSFGIVMVNALDTKTGQEVALDMVGGISPFLQASPVEGISSGSLATAIQVQSSMVETTPLPVADWISTIVKLPPANVIGAVELTTDRQISGWAYDPEMGTVPATVKILRVSDNAEIGIGQATGSRPGLEWVNKTGQNLGFSIAPSKIGQLGAVPIKVVVVDRPTGKEISLPLVGSATSSIQVATVTSTGAHEFSGCNFVTGWAYDPLLNKNPVTVEVLADNASMGKIAANIPRPGLSWLDGGGNHGFLFYLPDYLVPGTHKITVQYVDQRTGLTAQLSPLAGADQVTCTAPTITPPQCP
jgi:hypothetical protein